MMTDKRCNSLCDSLTVAIVDFLKFQKFVTNCRCYTSYLEWLGVGGPSESQYLILPVQRLSIWSSLSCSTLSDHVTVTNSRLCSSNRIRSGVNRFLLSLLLRISTWLKQTLLYVLCLLSKSHFYESIPLFNIVYVCGHVTFRGSWVDGLVQRQHLVVKIHVGTRASARGCGWRVDGNVTRT